MKKSLYREISGRLAAGVLAVSLLCNLAACGRDGAGGSSADGVAGENGEPSETGVGTASDWRSRPLQIPDDKYRTYYEIFVYSFYDSDGDGIGDIRGVIEKLDYLNDGDDATDTDLGINGIWLMPVMPSPTYHKYDTMDYMDIDPEYGTMADMEELLAECHARGIRVIIDLAMNHSSSGHAWFQQALSYLRNLPADGEPDAEECPYLDYYFFSREKKSGYEPVEGTDWYYEAQFWGGMPDLNLENEAVRREFEAVADFWLEKGADGFRLDAVKEYVSGSTEKNVEILTWFNSYVKEKDPDAYIVCECWMGQADYAKYYASGVDSMFAFSFADKSGTIANVVNGVQKASSYGRALADSAAEYARYNPDFIDAPFYTNHDLGRSAGYYAGEGSAEKTKMGHALNLLMSGSAFLYYGEELGMKGAGKDENKRAPMYWSKDKAAKGMCRGPADMENVQMKFDSLEEQVSDPGSIYRYVKDVIRLRNQNPEIARGEVKFCDQYSDDKICTIIKSYENSEILLIFNTSAETAEVSLEGLTVQDRTAGELVLLGELPAGDGAVQRGDDSVIMPAYSVAVLGCGD